MNLTAVRIRELREAHKVSPTELAAHISASKSSIYRYENGEIDNIPTRVVDEIAHFFGVSTTYLLGLSNEESNVPHTTIGQRVKELRTAKGVSQEELGKVIGVQKAAINKYESGLVENMKRTSIQKLATYFGVSPSYLMCFTDDPTPVSQRQSTENEIVTLVQSMSEDEKQMLLKIIKGMKS